MLAVAVTVGLFSLALVIADPSSIGPWLTAFAMAILSLAQVKRLSEIKKGGAK